jgi:hypothetical protein
MDMKGTTLFFTAALCAALAANGAEKKKDAPKEPDDPYGFTTTPLLPDGWHVHDKHRPQPPVVDPGMVYGQAPSDAVVLFDGTDLSMWRGTKQDDPKKSKYNPRGEALWKVESGYMECTPTGDLVSIREFGDCQIHIEWRTEPGLTALSQGRGNSGVYMMGRYEIQVLDCFENRTYADGMTGALYGQVPPMVNACRKPGEWQSYDIFFTAPRFDGDQVVSPAYVTVVLNGVLVQHHEAFLGASTYKRVGKYHPHGPTGPIRLQDHGNKTRFRNIWVRELKRDMTKPSK